MNSNGRWKRYAEKVGKPLGGYGALLALYNVGLASFVGWAASRKKLPKRIHMGDVLLLGVATHKLTRIVGKDAVTSVIRAPFVEAEPHGDKVVEKPVGHGLQRAMGDLLRCEYCLAPWIATGLYAGYALSPRTTRFIGALFSSVAVSDFLNRAYTVSTKRSEAPALGDGLKILQKLEQ